jgi:hypothetical protein
MQHVTQNSDDLVCTQQAGKQVPAQAVGCFRLSAGRAMSLLPQVSGELRVAHGQVWVTLGTAAEDASAQGGDHFMSVGDLLQLMPGQQVVMEVYSTGAAGPAQQPAYFSWEPDAAQCRVVLSRRTQHTEVRQSLADLGQALHQVGSALGRLTAGVVGQAVCALTLRRRLPRCA